ncbi:MAG TPA: hypothetical protein VK045_03605 [Ornithinicoccus sp.]|nr:hypothetical protein [Ornithinicoccus sp.]
MEHHADFAVALIQELEVETSADPGDGLSALAGRAIALGWWVDPRAEEDPGHEPTGTLYLVVDPRRARPYWVKQGDLKSARIR